MRGATLFLLLLVLSLPSWTPGLAYGAEPVTGVFGTWGPAKDRMFAVAKANGFQVVVSSDLRQCSSLGVKCLYPLWLDKKTAQDPLLWNRFLKDIRAKVQAYKDNPALYAWYVTDEPDGKGIPVARLKELNLVLQNSGNRKPTFTVLSSPDDWKPYISSFDIVAVDPYLDLSPQFSQRGTEKVRDWIARIRGDMKQLQLNRPLWVVLGAFEKKAKKKERPWFIKPTPQQFSKMVDIVRDAKVDGVLVFSLYVSDTPEYRQWDMLQDDPLLWETVRLLPKQLRQ